MIARMARGFARLEFPSTYTMLRDSLDLYTFFRPPAPYERLFVLTAPDTVPSQQTAVERE